MSTVSTPLTSEGQARKLVDQLTTRMVKAIMDGRLPAEQFQQLIEQERELRLGTRFVEWLLSIMALIVQRVVVHCNYDTPNAISGAIKSAKFDSYDLGLAADQIPLLGSGEIDNWVGELHFGKLMSTREVIDAVKEQTAGFATPLAALRYAAILPDQQRKYPLAIIFKVGGQLWFLVLDEVGGRRRVRVGRGSLDGGWHEVYRFLVACKPARNARA